MQPPKAPKAPKVPKTTPAAAKKASGTTEKPKGSKSRRAKQDTTSVDDVDQLEPLTLSLRNKTLRDWPALSTTSRQYFETVLETAVGVAMGNQAASRELLQGNLNVLASRIKARLSDLRVPRTNRAIRYATLPSSNHTLEQALLGATLEVSQLKNALRDGTAAVAAAQEQTAALETDIARLKTAAHRLERTVGKNSGPQHVCVGLDHPAILSSLRAMHAAPVDSFADAELVAVESRLLAKLAPCQPALARCQVWLDKVGVVDQLQQQLLSKD